MAKKRDLKKAIKEVAETTYAMCYVQYMTYSSEENRVKDFERLQRVEALWDDTVSRLNHPDSSMSKKQYFEKCWLDFLRENDAILEELGGVLEETEK